MKWTLCTLLFAGCATLPRPKTGVYTANVPPGAEEMSPLVAYASAIGSCDQAYSTATAKLLRMAQEQGADAVYMVRSVSENKLGHRQEVIGQHCFGAVWVETTVQGVPVKLKGAAAQPDEAGPASTMAAAASGSNTPSEESTDSSLLTPARVKHIKQCTTDEADLLEWFGENPKRGITNGFTTLRWTERNAVLFVILSPSDLVLHYFLNEGTATPTDLKDICSPEHVARAQERRKKIEAAREEKRREQEAAKRAAMTERDRAAEAEQAALRSKQLDERKQCASLADYVCTCPSTVSANAKRNVCEQARRSVARDSITAAECLALVRPMVKLAGCAEQPTQ